MPKDKKNNQLAKLVKVQSNKTDIIRKLLLKTVGKDPDLFCYYVSIQEAKELLGQINSNQIEDNYKNKPLRLIAEC